MRKIVEEHLDHAIRAEVVQTRQVAGDLSDAERVDIRIVQSLEVRSDELFGHVRAAIPKRFDCQESHEDGFSRVAFNWRPSDAPAFARDFHFSLRLGVEMNVELREGDLDVLIAERLVDRRQELVAS